VPGNDYKAFLRSHLGDEEFHRGGIYDNEGKFLAEHEGLEMFTSGLMDSYIRKTATPVQGGDKAAWFREGLAWAAEKQFLVIVWFDIQKEIDGRVAENLPPGAVGPL